MKVWNLLPFLSTLEIYLDTNALVISLSILREIHFACLIFKNWIGEQLATFFSKLEIRYKCFGYFSIPSIFLELLSFHFTSNSLFDFCCVILRFPLICFLLQLRKQSFVRKSSEGGELLTSTQKHLWWKKGESKNGKIFFWFFITFGCIDGGAFQYLGHYNKMKTFRKLQEINPDAIYSMAIKSEPNI